MLKLNEKAFTVVEIITGLVVLSIFVGSIATAINNLTYVNDRSYDQVLLNGVAENKIETLRSANFVALDDETVDFSDELPDSIGSPKSASYTITTSTIPEVGSSMKEIEITINYTVGRTAETATYKSFISELGIGQ